MNDDYRKNLVNDFAWMPEAQPVSGYHLSCGFCGHGFSPVWAYRTKRGRYASDRYQDPLVAICPGCNQPVYRDPFKRLMPPPSYGAHVQSVPGGISGLHDEARSCMRVGAFTSAVLACRKVLMAVAVDKGADEGKSFAFYIDHLVDSGFVAPPAKPWVDKIRTLGNEATHEVRPKSEQESNDALTFTTMLLQTIYEYPARLAGPSEG